MHERRFARFGFRLAGAFDTRVCGAAYARVGVVEAEERSHRIVSSRDLQEEEEELQNEQEEVEEQEQLNNDLVDILTVSMDRVHMGLTH